MRRAAIGMLLCLPVMAFGQSGPPQRPPTFQAGIEVIRLNLSVTDGRNRVVTGLSATDFAVFEDGIRQDLSFFTRDALPLSVALLVDCSASMEENLPVAQQAGSRFIRALRPEDLGQVVQFNGRMTVLREFTADQQALEAAIRSTRAWGPTVLYDALYVSLKQLRSQGKPGSSTTTSDRAAFGRRGHGFPRERRPGLELARQADVAVYVIGLRPDRAQDRLRLAFSQATYFLTTLTRDTEGQVYFTSSLSELDAVYGRIAEELRSQYTIGYVSGNDRHNGKWRGIMVRTPARENLQVRHKLGYYGTKG